MDLGPLLGFALRMGDRILHPENFPSSAEVRSARCRRWLRYLSPTAPPWLFRAASHSIEHAGGGLDPEQISEPAVRDFMMRVFDLAESSQSAQMQASRWAGEPPVARLLAAIAWQAQADGLTEVVITGPIGAHLFVRSLDGTEIMRIPVNLHGSILGHARLIDVVGWPRLRRYQRQAVEHLELTFSEDGGLRLRVGSGPSL